MLLGVSPPSGVPTVDTTSTTEAGIKPFDMEKILVSIRGSFGRIRCH
jgi:hypothetical protein